jgi:hypothetical protein
MRKEDNSLRSRPSIPEVAITLQQVSGIPEKINLSVEDENRQLRERNRELEAENAILRERETTLVKDCIETLNVVTDALRATQPGKETNRFFVDSEKRIENAEPEYRPFIILSRVKTAAAMIKAAPPVALEVESEHRFTYSIRTRTENRALALVDYMKRTETPALKSTEARHVLQEIEGKPLDRKIVHRALDAARGLLRASSEIVGGVSRIILQSTARPRTAGGGGSRPVHPDWKSWRPVTAPDGVGTLR